MTLPLVFRPVAQAEFVAASAWYEAKVSVLVDGGFDLRMWGIRASALSRSRRDYP
jgi:hypothetical protein